MLSWFTVITLMVEAARVIEMRLRLIALGRGTAERGHVRLTNNDRWFFVQLYRWFPSILKVLTIIRPETLLRWHRAGFRCYWRWKSRPQGGRPQIDTELRVLIRRMSVENPLWGAPRIHGEPLKLGFEVAQSSVVAAIGIGAADRMTYRCLVLLLADRISRREDAVIYRAGFSN